MRFILLYYALYTLYFLFKFTRPQDFVAFLNVGQGDAIFVQNHALTGLIDGGPDYTLDRFIDNELPFFKCKLDFILATHPHKDHIAGLARTLKRCQASAVLVNFVDYNSSDWKAFIRLAQSNSVLYNYPNLPKLSNNQVSIKFFAKSADTCTTDVNICSLVSLVTFKRHDTKTLTFLMTGDLYQNHVRELYQEHIDILKVPHHGGKNTVSTELLTELSPQLAVLSYGVPNRYMHPSSQTLNILKVNGIRYVDTSTKNVLVKVPR